MIYLDIKKDFKDFSLDINFTSKSSRLGLLGESGSGKSLTLKCLAGIIKPDSGKIILGNRILFDSEKGIDVKVQDRKIGYLFQDYALFPTMTVQDNIKVGIREKDHGRVKAILKKFEIEDIKDLYPDQISGGQKQRVALARILINEPDLILLDEPFSALDEFLKWKIELDVKNMLEEYQIPTILVSHDHREVYRFCEEIVVIENGKKQEQKSREDLFSSPSSQAGAKILGIINFSNLEVIKGKLYAKDWDYYFANETYDHETIVGVREEDFEITRDPKGFKAEIIELMADLDGTSVLLDTRQKSKNSKIILKLKKDQAKNLKLGQLLRLRPKKLYLLE